MLIRLSVETDEETIFSYETKNYEQSIIDPQLIFSFFEAMKHTPSLTANTIKQVQFYNMILYSKAYDSFTIRILVDESIIEEEIEKYFEEMSKEVYESIAAAPKGTFLLDKGALKLKTENILISHIKDPISKISDTISGYIKQKLTPKISLVGLSNAGKTSIKYNFFENWSRTLMLQTKPTVGVDYGQKFQEFLLHRIIVMDVGGQSAYRKLYLQQEELWKDISVLIFVVDIQDKDSFESASTYLKDIWRIILKVNKQIPNLSLFFHKNDPESKTTLNVNISKCLEVFRDFIDFSTIYFTSIYDNSSIIALIKTFYIGLPEIVLLRLLEKDFLQHFENQILPQFYLVARQFSENDSNEEFQQLESEIHKSAIKLGIAYKTVFQQLWLDYLMGEKQLYPNHSSSKIIFIEHKDRSLFLSVQDWVDQGFPERLTTLLFDGILEGMLKTFKLEPPEIIKRNGSTTWKVRF